MPLPKRIYLENHPYFIVFNTYHRIPLFISEICCEILVKNLEFYRNKYRFKLFGFAIIPCHFLGIFLPKKPVDISRIINDLKNYTRKIVLERIRNNDINDYYYPCGKGCFCEIYQESQPRWNSAVTRPESRNIGVPPPMGLKDIKLWQSSSSLRELLKPNTIWQRRFWDHVIRNDQDLEEKLNYVNHNAVKHGLVSDPVDYKYSSARNYYLNDHSLIKIDFI